MANPSSIGMVKYVLVGNPLNHVTVAREKVKFIKNFGAVGDPHSGDTRLLDVRDQVHLASGFRKGHEAFNLRQVCVVSEEENQEVAKALGIQAIHPGLLGENLFVSGINNLSALPPGTSMFFTSPNGEERTVSFFITSNNNPCVTVAKEIQRHNAQVPEVGKCFVKVAMGRRGIVAIVVTSGFIKSGDLVKVYLPE